MTDRENQSTNNHETLKSLGLPVFDYDSYIEMHNNLGGEVLFAVEDVLVPSYFTPKVGYHLETANCHYTHPYCDSVGKRWDEFNDAGKEPHIFNPEVFQIDYNYELSSDSYLLPENFTSLGATTAKYKTNGTCSGLIDVDGEPVIISNLVIGTFRDDKLNKPDETSLVYISKFEDGDYQRILSRFNKYIAFVVRKL